MQLSTWQKIVLYSFLVLGIVCAIYKIAPYFSSTIPLGYDPGVYRGIYTAYTHLSPWFQFADVPAWIRHEPLWGIISILVSKWWISIDIFLTFWLGFFSIAGWMLVFLVTKKYSKQTAIIAMILFRISIIQYHVFELSYFKQVIAIDLLLILLYLRDNKKYRYTIPFLTALILLHRSTTMYLWATSFVYLILHYSTTKKIDTSLIIVWLISGWIWLSLYGTLFPRLILIFFQPLITTIGWTGEQGDFFSVREFIWFTMFLLIPTIYAVYIKMKHKEYDMIVSLFIVWIVRVSCGLLNAKRMQPFLDLSMILMVAYALFHIFKQKKWRLSSIVYIVLSLQMLYYFWYVSENNLPLISKWELTSITTLQNIIPPNWIIIWTDSYFSPWIAGYAERDWITPGLSDLNTMVYEQWNARWQGNGKEKCTIFQVYKKLDRPLYMRQSKLFRKENIAWGTCFTIIREDAYHIVYQVVL